MERTSFCDLEGNGFLVATLGVSRQLDHQDRVVSRAEILVRLSGSEVLLLALPAAIYGDSFFRLLPGLVIMWISYGNMEST